jgi:hypothetical protein
MQLHPAMVTTLMAEHERLLRQRARQERMRPLASVTYSPDSREGFSPESSM